MAEDTKQAADNRPWLLKRTNQGKFLIGLATIIGMAPGAPVVCAIGGLIPVTTTMISAAVAGIGAWWGLDGAARRGEKGKTQE